MRVPFDWFECECDTGVVQIDSLHLDEARPSAARTPSTRHSSERVAREAALLREQRRPAGRFRDAPPLACAAAARAGIPSLVISNFTWDWIYSAYAEYVRRPQRRTSLRRSARPTGRRRKAGGCRCTAASTPSRASTDVPFVARHARADLDARGRAPGLDVPADRPVALSSFGGYGVERLRSRRRSTASRTGRS